MTETDQGRGMLIGRKVSPDSAVDNQVLLSYIPSVPHGLEQELMPDDAWCRRRGASAGSKAWLAAATRRACFPKPVEQCLARSLIEWLSARRLCTGEDGAPGAL
eukprot:9456486-Pyramimonas_sp.AAC.1